MRDRAELNELPIELSIVRPVETDGRGDKGGRDESAETAVLAGGGWMSNAFA